MSRLRLHGAVPSEKSPDRRRGKSGGKFTNPDTNMTYTFSLDKSETELLLAILHSNAIKITRPDEVHKLRMKIINEAERQHYTDLDGYDRMRDDKVTDYYEHPFE